LPRGTAPGGAGTSTPVARASDGAIPAAIAALRCAVTASWARPTAAA
jgi:hypothetical protein